MVIVAYLTDIGIFDGAGEQPDLEKAAPVSEHALLPEDWRTLSHTSSLGDLSKKTRADRRLQVSAGTLPQHADPGELRPDDVQVGFLGSRYTFSAMQEKVELDVEKIGPMRQSVAVRLTYRVLNISGEPAFNDRVLEMPASQSRCQITIPDRPEGDHFFVVIRSAICLKQKQPPTNGKLYAIGAADIDNNAEVKHGSRVPIADQRHRAEASLRSNQQAGLGQLKFAKTVVEHRAGPDQDSVAKIEVKRFNGMDGEIKCKYYTVEGTAKAKGDFTHVTNETLTFPGDCEQVFINVQIRSKSKWEAEDQFYVHLEDDGEVPILCQDVGSTVCTVKIVHGDSGDALAGKIVRALDQAFNFDAFQAGNHDWKEQFVMALRPVAGDEEEASQASVTEWTLHFIAVPWKIFFAFVPPTSYCNGWVCFFSALAFIGMVTAFISDLASLLGCCLGMPDAITAITIVALGTSLPDTFASKVAAVEDETADAAIGNVTGSNSVNVFLGLGMPWMVASIYWWVKGATPEWKLKYPAIAEAYPDGGFAVPAGDLVFSVIAFCIVSLIAITSIVFRRKMFGAELGGPTGVKMNTTVFFVCLWIFYVSVSSWKVLYKDPSMGTCVVGLVAGLFAVVLGMVVVIWFVHFYEKYTTKKNQERKDMLAEQIQNFSHQEKGASKWRSARRSVRVLTAMKDSGERRRISRQATDCEDALKLAGVLEDFKRDLGSLQGTCSHLEGLVNAQLGKSSDAAATLRHSQRSRGDFSPILVNHKATE